MRRTINSLLIERHDASFLGYVLSTNLFMHSPGNARLRERRDCISNPYVFKWGLQMFNTISCGTQSRAANNRVNTVSTFSTTGRSKQERCESAKT